MEFSKIFLYSCCSGLNYALSIPKEVQAALLSTIHPEYESLSYTDSHDRQEKICDSKQVRLLERDTITCKELHPYTSLGTSLSHDFSSLGDLG